MLFLLMGLPAVISAQILTPTIDSLVFPRMALGTDTCFTTVWHNLPMPKTPLRVDSARLYKGGYPIFGSSFRVSGTIPSLPVILSDSDSLVVSICFTARDTFRHVDTVTFSTPCGSRLLKLVGQGGRPFINATDRNYRYVVVGDEQCDSVTVRNVGALPMTLTGFTLHDVVNWTFDTLYNPTLPAVIQPGAYKRFWFCFHPEFPAYDSTVVDWQTDMAGDNHDSIKSWSYLRGEGLPPGIIWDSLG
jgi:hypothetical protein